MILSYRLENIQSWSGDSKIIPLASDRINTLIAKSETGKSVIVKMIKEMTFPHNWDYTTTSLLRRGCNSGRVSFYLDTRCICVYEIYKDGKRIHYLLTPGNDGKYEVTKWVNATEIPEEMEKCMGLILDRESKTIINVVDKHSPLPFSNSDLKCNARILSVITENPQLESALNTLNSWKEQCELASERVHTSCIRLYSQYSSIPREDTVKLQLKLNKKKLLLNIVEIMEPLRDEVNSLNKAVYCKPNEIKKVELDNEFEILSRLSSIKDEIELLNNLVYNKPVPLKNINLDNEILTLSNIKELDNELSNFSGIIENEPKPIKSIHKDMDNCLTIINKIKDIYPDVYDLYKIVKSKPVKIPNLTSIESIVDIVSNATYLDEIVNNCDKYEKCKNNKIILEDKIKKCEVELKICPLCGKAFNYD